MTVNRTTKFPPSRFVPFPSGVLPLFAMTLWLASSICDAQKVTLEQELSGRPMRELAHRAHLFGDPGRGAIRFYQAGLSCVQCHTAGEGEKSLGPDLAAMGERSSYEHVITSLLEPSKEVRPGYRSQRILLSDGRVLTGLVKKESEGSITLVVPGEERERTVLLEDIEARASSESIMPAGLINQLTDKNDFFDLVCFLVELGRAGPEGAAALKPDEALLQPPPLPEYESDLDHRGLISSWNQKSFNQGKRTYEGLCVNCHGTLESPGSLPNALRFGSGTFKNGSDPLSMYRTLTHGYKMMLPQRQLVPREKYDVIHYIREAYLKPHNPTQYRQLNDSYLASLPEGTMRGPAPFRNRPWEQMDYGPFLTHSYEVVGRSARPRPEVSDEDRERGRREGRPAERTWPMDTNFAFKGIAIQLDQAPGGVSKGSRFLVFEHDTMRVAGAWTGDGFIDWEGILLDGKHWRTPRTRGDLVFSNVAGPGWADPESGTFEDTRAAARDGRRYGPFPAPWLKYQGLFKHGDRVVISYRVGDAQVLEAHRCDEKDAAGPFPNSLSFVRILNVGKSSRDLIVRVAPEDQGTVLLNVAGGNESHALTTDVMHGDTVVRIPADATPVRLEVHLGRGSTKPGFARPPEDLDALTHGGPAQWPQTLETEVAYGNEGDAFSVDELTRPIPNPWKSRLRMSGLDFSEDGDTLIACCCDGDVWKASGIIRGDGKLTWQRIASGLFHPLGLKLVDGRIFVGCRDQIVELIDLNGDGETDHYRCFNDDHQVTEHFHEFAMGLQADGDGNLYYAKSARHALDSLIPQHGTLLRVSADGKDTLILANGFRAANGVCVNPDGSYFVTDQEGHWTPMNRINRVVEGGFYGNMYSYGAPGNSSDSAMQMPLCWPNKPFDRSPSELLWVNSPRWGNLNGQLLSLSYGYGKVFVLPHEEVDGHWQGGMCRLPLPAFDTGVMRARFHPADGHMYACGMNAWGSNQTTSPGGIYRIRATGKPMNLPTQFQARHGRLSLQFSDPIDRETASDPYNYLVETWDLKRTANYGSGRFNQRTLDIGSIEISEDRRTVHLSIPDLQPTWTIEVSCKLRGEDGMSFSRTLQGTIHALGD